MSVRPRIRELPNYDFEPRPSAVKLDQNELPFDLPDSLRERLGERLAAVAFNRYPDLDAHELRVRLAALHDWPVEGIVVTPGSNVLIQCLVIAAGLGQSVLTATPTFGVYRLQARMLGAELIEIPMNEGFSLPVSRLVDAMQTGRGVLFVANPAAPTGNLHPREELERLIAGAGDRWTIVIDEAYREFAGTDFSDLARQPSVVCIRTLSKAFGMAGARLGFALAEPDLARQVRKTVNPFNVSSLQQVAALTVLDHQELVTERARVIVRERERLWERLSQLPRIEAFPSVTNFILVRVDDGPRTYQELLRRGVVVRKQSGTGLENCLRVSVGTPDENDLFITAFGEALMEVARA